MSKLHHPSIIVGIITLSILALLTQNHIINPPPALNSKVRKLQSMITLRKMVVEGKSFEECQQVLGISRRTFYRYLKSLFEQDRQSLIKLNESEIIRQANILKARYLSIYETLTSISKDTSIDPEARLNACAALAELSRSIALIYSQAPAFIAAQNRKKNTPEQQQQEILEQAMAYSNQRRREESPSYYYGAYQRNVFDSDSSSSDQQTEEEPGEAAEEGEGEPYHESEEE